MKAKHLVAALAFLALCLACRLVFFMGPPPASKGKGSLTVTFAGLTNDPKGARLVQFKVANYYPRGVSFGIGEVQVLQSNSWPNSMRVAGGSGWLALAAGSERVFSIASSSPDSGVWRVPLIYAEDRSALDELGWRAKGMVWVISHWRPGYPLPAAHYSRPASIAFGPEMMGSSPRLDQQTNSISSADRTDQPSGTADSRH